jgi:hypothetical protein
MPADGCALYETHTQLRVLADQERELRVPGESAPRDPLLEWTRALEVSVVFVTAHEAIRALGLRTCADVVARLDEIDHFVETHSHLDPNAVFAENAALLAPYGNFQYPASAPATGDTADIVRAVQSLLIHFPQQVVSQHREREPELAHRCQLAWDGLRSFVARHVHPAGDVVATAGRAYAEGRLDIDEVATILGVAVADAVALLEEHGFRRSVDRLLLTDDRRRERLEALATERQLRGGRPLLDAAWVDREVVASQRIEDIDARPWLRR